MQVAVGVIEMRHHGGRGAGVGAESACCYLLMRALDMAQAIELRKSAFFLKVVCRAVCV